MREKIKSARSRRHDSKNRHALNHARVNTSHPNDGCSDFAMPSALSEKQEYCFIIETIPGVVWSRESGNNVAQESRSLAVRMWGLRARNAWGVCAIISGIPMEADWSAINLAAPCTLLMRRAPSQAAKGLMSAACSVTRHSQTRTRKSLSPIQQGRSRSEQAARQEDWLAMAASSCHRLIGTRRPAVSATFRKAPERRPTNRVLPG